MVGEYRLYKNIVEGLVLKIGFSVGFLGRRNRFQLNQII